MTAEEELFETIAAELGEGDERVSRNSRGSLTVAEGARSSVRAMTSGGRIVVKLDAARTAALVADGGGAHYKGQPNAWLELRAGLDPDTVRALIAEALERRG